MLAVSFIIMYSVMFLNVDEAKSYLSKHHENLYGFTNGITNGCSDDIDDGQNVSE